jgi:hypothetical protein
MVSLRELNSRRTVSRSPAVCQKSLWFILASSSARRVRLASRSKRPPQLLEPVGPCLELAAYFLNLSHFPVPFPVEPPEIPVDGPIIASCGRRTRVNGARPAFPKGSPPGGLPGGLQKIVFTRYYFFFLATFFFFLATFFFFATFFFLVAFFFFLAAFFFLAIRRSPPLSFPFF